MTSLETTDHVLWPKEPKAIHCLECGEEIIGCNYDPDTGICYQCSSYLNNEIDETKC
jgi:hypothetical protein